MIDRYRNDALLRLKTARGHLDGVIAMVEREAYCPEIMKQVGAVQASLERVNRVLLRNHLETCVTEAIQSGAGDAKITELMDALRFTGALTDLRTQVPPAVGDLGDSPEELGDCPEENDA